MWAMILHLCEGKPSLIVDFEDLFDGVDIGGCPKVQTQVVLACCTHDLLKKAEETTLSRRTHQTGGLQQEFPACAYQHLVPAVVVSEIGISDLWTIDNYDFKNKVKL